eukprot:scaffold461_cov131-Isochrysis_galbana.AAC.5
MGGTAHQPSRPPMAARCQALARPCQAPISQTPNNNQVRPVQPQPASARREPPYPELAQSA